jgi:DNA-binding response OmpR family regulator
MTWALARDDAHPAEEPTSTVLVVDDEALVRDIIVRYLEREGFRGLEAADGLEARVAIQEHAPDLVILDVMLPEIDGLELCRALRATSDVPVIFLTARGEENDRVTGLELGADDYVVKPFSPRELMERVKAILRRSMRAPSAQPSKVSAGGLTIDANTREVIRAGRKVDLTATEFDLLWCLASHPREVFSRQQLMAQVWGYRAALDAGTSTVTVHIRRLREKIETCPSEPELITTVWGVGYRFEP